MGCFEDGLEMEEGQELVCNRSGGLPIFEHNTMLQPCVQYQMKAKQEPLFLTSPSGKRG